MSEPAARALGWQGLGIRARLFLVVTLVLGGVSLAISLYFPAHARVEGMAALVREASTVGRVAAHGITPAILFDDPTDAEQVLETLRTTTGVSYLLVTNARGDRFAAVGSEPNPDDLGGPGAAGTPAAGTPAAGMRPRVHRTSTPIVHADKRLGMVHVGVSLADLERDVKLIRNGIWGLSAILFLLATGVTVALGARVIRPLAVIARTAERISQGERDERAPVTGSDEVGTLARSVNRMLDHLLTARQELESLNRGLERRVDERTLALGLEVAERKRGQEAVLRANERFELAAAAVEGAIYDWDVLSDRLLWSDGLARAFGHLPHEIPGTGAWWMSQIHPDDAVRVAAQIETDFAAGRDVLREYRFATSSGRYLTILDRGRVIYDAGGQAIRVVGVMENITALRQLEEQYLHSQRMEAVGQLAGGVAHDFNNLLTIILGHGEILGQRLDSGDPRHKHVSEIRKAGDRAAGLTAQLLTFSRKQPVSPMVLDVGVVLSELEDMLGRLIGENILIETRLPPRRLCVRADRSQLDQLVINVAVNARDAMPAGGALTIAASEVDLDEAYVRRHLGAQVGPHVLIEIQDTGVGMSDETLARLFEPFYTTKEIGKGTGLGMSIVYGVVAQCGGHVAVRSKPGVGTSIAIHLPLVEGEGDQAAGAAAPAPSGRGAERLLVVEDEEALRGLLVEHLTDEGYEVLAARDGEQALQTARAATAPIDLVLTDLVMPGISGRELADRLALEHSGLLVVFMSGYPQDRTRDHADLATQSNYLHKPFSLDELSRKIRESLDAPRAVPVRA